MKQPTKLPTKEELHRLFEYRDGRLYWRARPGVRTNRKPGIEAGTPFGVKGYLRLCINYRFYYAHRIVWAMHYGTTPHQIDHINGDPSDNRIENLREATASENMRNSRLNKRNSSGIKGVARCKKTGRWVGSVCVDGVTHRTRSYAFIEDCAEAVQRLRAQLHGEYARHVSSICAT